MGKISFWALLVYLAFRVGDLAIRQQLTGAFSGKAGALFAAEMILGGFLPLALLATTFRQLRARLAGRRSASLRFGCRVQSHQCRSVGHGPEGTDAAECSCTL